ncbi:MAG: sigma-70 family RNA polymerase sigma factor, partial [bacterium]
LELTSESSIPASGADPASEAANRETGRLIQAAILALPEDQRTALILSVYHDMSQAEVARVMKTTEKSVESRLYRARQFLRARLAELMRL